MSTACQPWLKQNWNCRLIQVNDTNVEEYSIPVSKDHYIHCIRYKINNAMTDSDTSTTENPICTKLDLLWKSSIFCHNTLNTNFIRTTARNPRINTSFKNSDIKTLKNPLPTKTNPSSSKLGSFFLFLGRRGAVAVREEPVCRDDGLPQDQPIQTQQLELSSCSL